MNLLWLQASGCGGCTMSLLCAENPNVFDTLSDAGIRVLWHPALSLESGAEVRRLLDRIAAGEIALDLLCIEGAIARGPRNTGRFQMLTGTGRSMMDWVQALAPPRAPCHRRGELRGLWWCDLGGGQSVRCSRRAI